MNTQSIYNGLDYTTKEINRNFKIKVNGIVNGKKVNVLVGVSSLIKIVGDIKLVNRLLKRAFNCYGDKEVCKLRRGVKNHFLLSVNNDGAFSPKHSWRTHAKQKQDINNPPGETPAQ